MFNIFHSNVFIEIGEAIGNVGRRLKRRSHPELVDRTFRRRLKECTVELPDKLGQLTEPTGEVIEVEYRILDEEEVSL